MAKLVLNNRGIGLCVSNLFNYERELFNCQTRYFNSHRASIAKVGRNVYMRSYPTLLVQPDGSTITIRYHLPQKIIKLPVDLSKLSEEELKLHLHRRKPIEKIIVEEEIEDEFNENQYSHLWKPK